MRWLLLVSTLIVSFKMTTDYLEAREVYSKKTQVSATIANDRLTCLRTRSIPKRYCQMRSSTNVIDRRHEWDGRSDALLAEIQRGIIEELGYDPDVEQE